MKQLSKKKFKKQNKTIKQPNKRPRRLNMVDNIAKKKKRKSVCKDYEINVTFFIQNIWTTKLIYILLPISAAEIVECMCKYVGRISQNLQSLNPY